MVRRPFPRLVLVLCALSIALVPVGCGSSSSSSITTAKTSAAALWRNRTQQICADGRRAITKLGYVHITNAGIERIGLPAVKHKLDVYVGRLLAILQTAAQQQQALHPPAELSSAATAERQIEMQEQEATQKLRSNVAGAQNGDQLGAAFRAWLQSDGQLVDRGNALARQYGLPACAAAATP